MTKKTIRAVDALQDAQKIAFAPFIFQTTMSLRKLGVFDLIFNERSNGGISIEDVSKKLSISEYGLGVLLEIAESYGIVSKDTDNRFELTKTGYFLNYNRTVEVNLNFTNDVCYQGLFHLNDAIKNGKPEGLKELGDWDTIYDGLSQLTPDVQKSWFEFDHHYSDGIFEEALTRVFKNHPKTLFDIGGNTGKFAQHCLNYNNEVNISIFDLPGQLKKALANIKKAGFEHRAKGYEINWLHDNLSIPKGADVIWMSQFLDCFSEAEIIKILKTCVASMNSETELIIIETFTDRQKFDNAKFVLEATSLYFTVMANGNSKMYNSEVFKNLVAKAGLTIVEDTAVGEFHTMLVCKK
ncbi:methyltransferase domain-containing protein [Subsaxibacter sp. CAU 1640]|uniref:methyltransferase n=1 Tax=Subsaxibacter sp. CAU 1640 TaxID=2933271 RepID=UPI002002C6BF|nr:methyltransferase [Subsaxibacter sp. CAU 1640]MCK7589451.1 methyltransferase domain-containing protein [Subsaxibacter sp. CAU 1640]